MNLTRKFRRSSQLASACLIAGILAAGSGAPLPAEEFCTAPPAGANDRACAGAVADGFGGLLVYEHERAPQTHLVAMAQWIDGDFAPEGPPLVLAEAPGGPMWRPRAVLLNPDTAFVIWCDGRARRSPESYAGFDLRGAVLRRGDPAPAEGFVIAAGSDTTGAMDPLLLFDPATATVVVGFWLQAEGTTSTTTDVSSLLGFSRDSLLSAARQAPEPAFQVPGNNFSALAFDHQRRLLRLNRGWDDFEVTAVWPADENPTPSSRKFPFAEAITPFRAAEGPAPYVAHFDMAVGPNGELAMVGAVVRERQPLGYLAMVTGDRATDGIARRAWYQGPVSADWNITRPRVAFSGEEPVLFLPITDAAGAPALFVGPLGDGEINATEGGATYPLPGGLEQFDILIADHGTSAKAALIATSGNGTTRLCAWPSELIGY